jgi:hypothetical protein
MKRILLYVALGMLCFAQGSITITVPSDIATKYGHAQNAEAQSLKQQAQRLSLPAPESASASSDLASHLATVICDAILKYSPADAPARKSGESEMDYRNRFQQEIRSKISVTPK